MNKNEEFILVTGATGNIGTELVSIFPLLVLFLEQKSIYQTVFPADNLIIIIIILHCTHLYHLLEK